MECWPFGTIKASYSCDSRRCWKWGSDRSADTQRKDGGNTHTEASFPTIGAVIILQGTDDLIIGVSDRERTSQRRSRRHGLHESVSGGGVSGRGEANNSGANV